MLHFFANLIPGTANHNKENAAGNKRDHAGAAHGLKEEQNGKDVVKRGDKAELDRNRETLKSLQSCLSVSSAPLNVKNVLAHGEEPKRACSPMPITPQTLPEEGKLDSVVELEQMAGQMARIDLQGAVEEQTIVTKDNQGEEDDGEGVESHPYVKAPAAHDDKEVVPDAREGQDDLATETADLILAIDALVLAKGKEDKADKDKEVQAQVEATKNAVVHGDQHSIAEAEAKEDEEDEEEDTPPSSVEDADARIQDVLERLKIEGVPVMDKGAIKFGALLGEGAFGTVKLAQVDLDGADTECAVKTIVAKGKTFNERLAAFETEAKVSWLASQTGPKMKHGQRSRICRTLAIAYSVSEVRKKAEKKQTCKTCKVAAPKTVSEDQLQDLVAGECKEEGEEAAGESTAEEGHAPDAGGVRCGCCADKEHVSAHEENVDMNLDANVHCKSSKKCTVGYTIKGKLHLVMEKLESRGDLHKEVTDSRWWDAIRSNGEDTGARLRANYTMTDDEGDLFAYSMPRRLKLHLAQEFAHGMLQMRRCNIVHCDIKPCNVMLVTVPHAKEGKAAVPGLKIIDFGEGNTPEEATGFVAGTPGYQAPEVVEDGLCTFASDIYSAGVSLIELWAGDMWAGADTRGEGYLGQRCEVLDALAKIHKADPKVAALLRRCIAENPAHRPSALQLLKGFKTMSAQAQGPARLISRRGRAWAANK